MVAHSRLTDAGFAELCEMAQAHPGWTIKMTLDALGWKCTRSEAGRWVRKARAAIGLDPDIQTWRVDTLRQMVLADGTVTPSRVLADPRFQGIDSRVISRLMTQVRRAARVPSLKVRAGRRDAIVRVAILDSLVENPGRLTVRQMTYLVGAKGVVAEAKPYDLIQRLLCEMRDDGTVPWDRIEDRSRDASWTSVNHSQRFEPIGLQDIIDAFEIYRPSTLEELADSSRASLIEEIGLDARVPSPLWTLPQLDGEHCVRPLVFAEKDTLYPQVEDALRGLNVDVFSTRGFSSYSQTYALARAIMFEADTYGISHIALWVRDHDISGLRLQNAAMHKLREHGAEVDEEIVALTPEQIEEWGIALHLDAIDHFQGAAEVEAIPPGELPGIVRRAVLAHLPDGVEERIRILRARRGQYIDLVTDAWFRPDGELDEERVETMPDLDDLQNALDDAGRGDGGYDEVLVAGPEGDQDR